VNAEMKRTLEEHYTLTINDIPGDLIERILNTVLTRAVVIATPSPENFFEFITVSRVCKTWELVTDLLWRDAFATFRWHEENVARISHVPEEKKCAEKSHPKYWKYQVLHGISRRALLYDVLPAEVPMVHCLSLDEFPHKIPNSLRDAICVCGVDGIIEENPKNWTLITENFEERELSVPPLPEIVDSRIPVSSNFVEFPDEKEEKPDEENSEDYDPTLENSNEGLSDSLEDIGNPEISGEILLEDAIGDILAQESSQENANSQENPQANSQENVPENPDSKIQEGNQFWNPGVSNDEDRLIYFSSEHSEEFSYFLFDELQNSLFDKKDKFFCDNVNHPEKPFEDIPGIKLIAEIAQDYMGDNNLTKSCFDFFNFLSAEYIIQVWKMAEKLTEENLGQENLCEISLYNENGFYCESSVEYEEVEEAEETEKNDEKEEIKYKFLSKPARKIVKEEVELGTGPEAENIRKKILYQKTFCKNMNFAISKINQENVKKSILWGKYDKDVISEENPQKTPSEGTLTYLPINKHNYFFVWKFQNKVKKNRPEFLEMYDAYRNSLYYF
jgi:hypothetical protein